MRLFPKKHLSKGLKTRVNCQNLGSLNRTNQKITCYAQLTVKSCFVKDTKRAGSVCMNAIRHYLKRLWLVAIATME